MDTAPPNTRSTEAAILSRLIHPQRGDLSEVAATALLRIGFDQEDLDRLHDLVKKNQDVALSSAERQDLDSYLRISLFVDLIHAKAHHSLRNNS